MAAHIPENVRQLAIAHMNGADNLFALRDALLDGGLVETWQHWELPGIEHFGGNMCEVVHFLANDFRPDRAMPDCYRESMLRELDICLRCRGKVCWEGPCPQRQPSPKT